MFSASFLTALHITPFLHSKTPAILFNLICTGEVSLVSPRRWRRVKQKFFSQATIV